MAENPAPDIEKLISALLELEGLVNSQPAQPTSQLAENAVLLWLRVLDGKDFLMPRLALDGIPPELFHAGMEETPENRLDALPPAGDLEGLQNDVTARLGELGAVLETYFSKSGYRSSTENCDRTMMTMNHLSRFFSGCCREAEFHNLTPTQPAADVFGETSGESSRKISMDPAQNFSKEYLELAQRNFFIWEPALNAAIVAWEQNNLNEFNKSLQHLKKLWGLSETERDGYRIQNGYPLRPRGRPRLMVTVFEPELRTLRAKSMFSIRFSQLIKRTEEMMELPPKMISALESDVLHFTLMVKGNNYMLAGEVGFWGKNRAGLPLIKVRTTSHPLLNDAMDFFKKAVLFNNRTYTVAGGGVDMMYLKVKQLERFFKFDSSGSSRALRFGIRDSLFGWEENKLGVFTENLLKMAELLRAGAEGSASQ